MLLKPEDYLHYQGTFHCIVLQIFTGCHFAEVSVAASNLQEHKVMGRIISVGSSAGFTRGKIVWALCYPFQLKQLINVIGTDPLSFAWGALGDIQIVFSTTIAVQVSNFQLVRSDEVLGALTSPAIPARSRRGCLFTV